MTTYCQVLTPHRLRKKGLRSWNAAFPKSNGTYQALYPQSWTVYDLPGQNVRLMCKQLSPVIPHNYEVNSNEISRQSSAILAACQDSSLPVTSFVWHIENLNDEEIEVSLMFTWQAGSGSTFTLILTLLLIHCLIVYLASQEFPCRDVSHEKADFFQGHLTASGVSIRQTLRDMKLEYCLMAKKEVFQRVHVFKHARSSTIFSLIM
jgi:hypothetical protein